MTSETPLIETLSNLESSKIEVNTKLIIDTREHDMIEYCLQQNIAHETQSLNVGDILLTLNEESLVFERKTLADLVASIKDGRYREQKQRLKSSYPFHRITYIIEGNTKDLSTKQTIHGMPVKSVTSALVSSRYRDGFQVIHTLNMIETMWYVTQIRDRMGEKTTLITNNENSDYKQSLKVKTKKIDNLTPELVYIMQLSQLPGISVKIAEDIAKVYPSFSELLKGISEYGVKAFDNVAGMGKTRSKKLLEYIK